MPATPIFGIPYPDLTDDANVPEWLQAIAVALEAALGGGGGGGGGAIPAGLQAVWTGPVAGSIPGGWLLCDGTAVSRTTYATLFGVIGSAYGAGNGSTTFNVPNLKGRVVVGLDAAQTEFDALAEAAGEKTHVLTTGEMPAHTHGVQGSAGALTAPFTGVLGPQSRETDADFATDSAGGGGAHNNLQPYIVERWIIKI